VTPARRAAVPRHGYLGPEGTFCETALDQVLTAVTEAVRVPFPTVPTALAAVRQGDCTSVVVPVENSVKGVVQATLDVLSAASQLRITGEVELPVAFALMARPGTELGDVVSVLSHPHALAQCGRWLADRLPQALVLESTSTAAAARQVARSAGLQSAAIAAPASADRYGLAVLATRIGDRADAVTRFVAVSRTAYLPAPSGSDRTSLVVSTGDGSPGALAEILAVLAAQDVCVTSVQPWPTGDGLGRYRFFIDVTGHIEDLHVRQAMTALPAVGAQVGFLGTYPRTPRGVLPPPPRPRRQPPGSRQAPLINR
jgi:prephenate dehydratase